MARHTLEMSPETEEKLQRLMRGTRCLNHTELFRRALALLEVAVDAEKAGKYLAVAKDGQIVGRVKIEVE